MEAASASAIARGMAEYGILGLGWVLFLFTMLYIRVERKRYQDLVIHIIQYFTKIHMLEGKDNDEPPFPASMFGITSTLASGKRKPRRAVDPETND